MNKESGSDASSAGCSNSSSFTVPAARRSKIHKRVFCLVWLEDPEFKPWLQQVPQNPHKGKCRCCDVTITAIKSNLQRHGNSQEHIKNMTCANNSVETTVEATGMDVGTESNSDNSITVSTEKNGQRQTFVAEWLEDPAFKPWLQQVPQNPYKAICKCCNITTKAKKYNIQRHASTHEHLRNMKYGTSAVERSTDSATSMDVETDSSSDTFTVPVKKKVWKQTFLADWLEDPMFQPWLQHVQHNPYLGKCTFCDIHITARKCNLQQHAKSEKHIHNMKYGRKLIPGEGTRSFADQIKEAEIRVCTDAIENNRSFNSLKHYVKLSQEVCKSSDVVKHMSLSGKKMKAISLNVINKSIVGKSIEKVQGKFFSVFIDETTDVSNTKLLCFLIRYVHKEQICTDLLDLIRVKECTAENIYQCFRYSLKKYNLSLTNMVGVCVDNENGMVGAHNSLTNRLVANNGEICILPCICHSIDLAARKACECLPQYVEKFLLSLYSYFSRNPKQLGMLEGTQQFAKFAKRKVVQSSDIRWLAQSECIKRVLDQWTVLFDVFAEASSERHADAAKRIFSSFNCLYTKAYLQFMDYILVIFIELSKLLQSSKVLVHRLLPECYRLLKTLGGNFLQYEHLKQSNIHKINVNNEDNLLPLTEIFTGAGCMTTLSKIANGNLKENEDMMQFYTNIKKCYQSAFQNIVNRVPFDDKFLNALDFLNPQTALDINKHQHGQLNCILNKFKSKFDYALVLNEWRLLPFTFSEKAKEKLQVMSLPQFWHEMSIVTNAEDECILPNISKVAQLCLSLPHSNADAERYFSTVVQIRTGDRSRLNPETVAAITRIKLDLKNKNEHWNDFKITDDMLNLFDNSMYNKEEIPEELIGILLPDEMNESESDKN